MHDHFRAFWHRQDCLELVWVKNSNTVEPLGTDTSILRTFSNVPTKSSYIFFKKKPLQCGLSIIRTTDTKSRPQRVNSYNLTPLLRTLRWSGESRIQISWICTGWIPSGWWAMQGDFKSPSLLVYQTTICKRCAEEHNRLFQGLNNYR